MVTPITVYAIALATLILDQTTKTLATSFTRITTNTGAAFGILPNTNTLLAITAALVALFLVLYLKKHPLPELGLLLGGTLGNLTDRIRLGHVTDFIHLPFWPSFNLADTANTIAVLLLILRWRNERDKPQNR